jgi:hypothetical protein
VSSALRQVLNYPVLNEGAVVGLLRKYRVRAAVLSATGRIVLMCAPAERRTHARGAGGPRQWR